LHITRTTVLFVCLFVREFFVDEGIVCGLNMDRRDERRYSQIAIQGQKKKRKKKKLTRAGHVRREDTSAAARGAGADDGLVRRGSDAEHAARPGARVKDVTLRTERDNDRVAHGAVDGHRDTVARAGRARGAGLDRRSGCGGQK
jgi:hypothetical protein